MLVIIINTGGMTLPAPLDPQANSDGQVTVTLSPIVKT